MLFPSPRNPQPMDDVVLWRYLDLYKFQDMASSGTLYCRRADKLVEADSLEGSMTPAADRLIDKILSKEIVSGYRAKGMKAISGFSIAEGSALDATKRLRAVARQHYRYQLERTFVSCWHSNTVESALMWASYIDNARDGGLPGVAVKTTVGQLKAAIGDCRETIITAPIDYVDHKAIEEQVEMLVGGIASVVLDSLTKKQKPFHGEQEFRLLVDEMPTSEKYDHLIPARNQLGQPNAVQEVRVPLDLATLIESIYLPPRTGSQHRAAVDAILQGRLAGLQLRVKPSALQ